MEEAGEITQAASKVTRFGNESFSPYDDKKVPNSVALAREVGNLLACVELLGLDEDEIETGRLAKLAKIEKFGI